MEEDNEVADEVLIPWSRCTSHRRSVREEVLRHKFRVPVSHRLQPRTVAPYRIDLILREADLQSLHVFLQELQLFGTGYWDDIFALGH